MNKDVLLFSKEHVWILCEENQNAKIGISDYAQGKLGAIVFINLPEIDEKLVQGEAFGDVESIKTVSDMISPVDGVVIKVNEEVLDESDCINSNPYSSWLLEVSIEKLPDDLMNEAAYTEYVEKL